MASEGGSFKDNVQRFGSRAKDRMLGIIRRVKNHPSSVSPTDVEYQSPALPDILPTDEEFRLGDYHYLREAYYQLQIGHKGPETNFEPLVLPHTTAEFSSGTGQMGTIVGRDMLVRLREGRVNQEGKPYVICIDEVTDSQVLQGATAEDRIQSFRESVQRILKPLPFSGFWLAGKTSHERFALAAVSMGSLILGQRPQQIRELINDITKTTEELTPAVAEKIQKMVKV